ncbi:MAG TPA: CDGSH iron-sulfur domain-containing protein [Aquihabitans sp.]|jgi:CDGSH-type Zn-finger protein|nr:CDGSH iron-sulfur domain-containing protein [Aquihabitans sp.]
MATDPPPPSLPEPDPAGEPAAATVTPRADGPIVVEGPLRLTAADGTATTVERVFLCRCGASATKPLCDGSHKRIGFRADGVPPTSRGGSPS